MKPNLNENINDDTETVGLGLASICVKSRDPESGISDVYYSFVNSDIDESFILDDFNQMNNPQNEGSSNVNITSDSPLSGLSLVGDLPTLSERASKNPPLWTFF